MSKQELVVIPKQLPMEIPQLPPLPVWDEHVDAYLARAATYRDCKADEDFQVGKELAGDGVWLKNQIKQSYDPLTQAIDALKAPIVAQRDQDIALVANSIKKIDAISDSFKREQDRIAQAKADEERRERDRKREEERQAKIKEEEAKRQAEIKRREEERQAELKRLQEQITKNIEIAQEWGEEADVGAPSPQIELPPIDEPPPVVIPEIIPSRYVTVDSGFKGRRGSRTKSKMVITVIDPDVVNRQYCSPDRVKYEAKAKSHFAQIKDPSPEQIKKIEDEIGGVKISWE